MTIIRFLHVVQCNAMCVVGNRPSQVRGDDRLKKGFIGGSQWLCFWGWQLEWLGSQLHYLLKHSLHIEVYSSGNFISQQGA
jgi:hypothetical protein